MRNVALPFMRSINQSWSEKELNETKRTPPCKCAHKRLPANGLGKGNAIFS